MKRRHQLALVTTGLLCGLATAVVPAAPAAAMPKIAGVGQARTGGTPLNARSGPSSAAPRTGTLADGRYVSIVCQVIGQHVNGTVRATRIWDRLPNGSYVSDAYVARRWFPIPVCRSASRAEAAPVSPGMWTAPVAAGLVSGFRSVARPAHDGIDLAAPRYTPIRAAAAGTVIRVVCNVSAGTCDVDGNRTLRGCGWYAEILHPGNVVTRYCHLVRRPAVNVGQAVAKGQVIGYVGSSGSSSGPHLHFEVHVNAPPAVRANAVDPLVFLRARGVPLG